MDEDPVVRLVHDLRTPLAVVGGFSELLQRKGDALTPEQRKEYADRIADGVAAMNELLDAARTEGG